MKNLFLMPALIIAVSVVSCGRSNSDSSVGQIAGTAVSVDSVFLNPDSMVGDTLLVEGVCSHLCKHGGKKAFLVGSDDNVIIRCESTADMGGFFPQETVHKVLRVRGVLRESRIDEQTVALMEQQHADQVAQLTGQLEESQLDEVANNPGGCDTERKAQGQADIASFADRMADYRAKIAERSTTEGKPYLSTYYIESLSYEILPE